MKFGEQIELGPAIRLLGLKAQIRKSIGLSFLDFSLAQPVLTFQRDFSSPFAILPVHWSLVSSSFPAREGEPVSLRESRRRSHQQRDDAAGKKSLWCGVAAVIGTATPGKRDRSRWLDGSAREELGSSVTGLRRACGLEARRL